MDLIHKVTNIIDHNRGTASGVAVLVASLILAGCSAFDGVVPSSTSGELLNQDELRVEYVQHSNDLQTRYDMAIEMIDQGNAQIREVDRDADRLNESFQTDSDLAAGEIAARSEKIGTLASLVATTAGVPWLLPLVSIGTTAAATGAVYDNRRKDRLIKTKKSGT